MVGDGGSLDIRVKDPMSSKIYVQRRKVNCLYILFFEKTKMRKEVSQDMSKITTHFSGYMRLPCSLSVRLVFNPLTAYN